jgi:hypothetical protein
MSVPSDGPVMHAYPSLPPADGDDAPPELLEGHVWLREYVEGQPLRFSVADSGLLAFADGDRPFDGDPPHYYRPAVRAVREAFDRDAFREAVADPTAVTFHGVATCKERAGYDWPTTPAFLGTELHHDDRGGRLAVDAAVRAFDRLGLTPVPTLQKEVRARHFSLSRYEFPESAYRAAPVAGVVVRNRNGARGLLATPAAPDARDPLDPSAEAVAGLVTEAVVDRVAGGLPEGVHADPDVVTDRVLETLARERRVDLYDGPGQFRPASVRRAVGARVRERLLDAR